MKLFAAVCLVAAVACDKNADLGPAPEPVRARPTTEQGGPAANPHGDMAANPHAGMGGNSHGDMGNPHGDTGGMPNDDIHAGMRMPQAEYDPKLALDGTIEVPAKLVDQVKAGDILFLFAKKVGSDGKPYGGPVAVDRLDIKGLPATFHLDGGNLMMQGTKFDGTVMLFARIDRDGEARTREKGDLEGTLQATIPASGLKLVLDTPVE